MVDNPMITVRLKPEEHRAFKLYCVRHGLTMSSVVRGLLKQALHDAETREGDMEARQQGGEEE